MDTRHEQACRARRRRLGAALAQLGVAMVTAGPGVTDAVTGVANAILRAEPAALIGGAAPLGLRGLGALQETEQVGLLRPVTKGAWTVAETRQIPRCWPPRSAPRSPGGRGPCSSRSRWTCS